MATPQTGRNGHTVRMDGEQYRIQIYHESQDSAYEGEVVLVRAADDQRWRFGVGAESRPHLLTSTAGAELVATPAVPEWCELLLAGIGLRAPEED